MPPGTVVAVVSVVGGPAVVGGVFGGGSVPSEWNRATPWATTPLTLWNCPATRIELAVTCRSSTPWTPLIVGAHGWMAPVCWSKAARWPRTWPATVVK